MSEDIRTHFVKVGLALLVLAIVGGGASAAGFTIPVISSLGVRATVGGLGVVLVAAGLVRRRPLHTFIVTSPRASISVPQGTIANPSYKTTRFGGQESRIQAAAFHRTADGKRVLFTDRRGHVLQDMPSSHVADVRRA